MPKNIRVPVVATVAVVAVLIAWLGFTFSVPAGHVGVVTSFGHIESTADPGLHAVMPWKRVTLLSVRTQEEKETAEVPTKEGVTVHLEASLLYSLRPDQAQTVFSTFGPDYKGVIVLPQFRSALRSATVNYQAKDLYTAHRSAIEHQLETQIREMLAPSGVAVEKVLLRNITLPEKVKIAIEAKLAAEQEAERMQFVLAKERQEAERREVEAQGVAKAQQIIQGTLTENYIRYLWVKALENNAQHPSTVIYVPIGQDGLPLVQNANPRGRGAPEPTAR